MIENITREPIVLSGHAFGRLKARCGFSKKAAIRMARRAYQDGINEDDVKGTLRKFLRKQLNQKANKVMVYGEYVYLFHYQTLITVFELPNRFKREAAAACQMKNPKRFM